MKNTERFNRLIDKYLNGNLSPKEEELLNRFSARMQEQGISEEEIRRNLALRNQLKSRIDRQLRHRRFSLLGWSSVAAVLVVALLAGYQLFKPVLVQAPQVYAQVSTKTGNCKTVWLSDSTKVVLNADSYLRYPKSFKGQKQRVVELCGEAYFEVTHRPAQPFVVHTTSLSTRVLGTCFNVCSYQNETPQVVVVSGMVKVSDQQNHSVYLTKNQRVHAVHNRLVSDSVSGSEYTSWLSGKLNFKDATIREVVQTINHHVSKKLVLGPSLTNFNKRINGNYAIGDIHDILSGLEFIYSIHSVEHKQSIQLDLNSSN